MIWPHNIEVLLANHRTFLRFNSLKCFTKLINLQYNFSLMSFVINILKWIFFQLILARQSSGQFNSTLFALVRRLLLWEQLWASLEIYRKRMAENVSLRQFESKLIYWERKWIRLAVRCQLTLICHVFSMHSQNPNFLSDWIIFNW